MPTQLDLTQISQDGANSGEAIIWNSTSGIWNPGTVSSAGTINVNYMGSESYSLTASLALIEPSGQAPLEMAISSAGYYIIDCTVYFSGANNGDELHMAIYDTAASAFVPAATFSAVTTTQSGYGKLVNHLVYFTSSPTVLQVQVANVTAARGIVPAQSSYISCWGSSSALYPDPEITSFSPTSGESTAFTITGSGFTGATAVAINGTACTSVVVVSDTSITAVSPASFTNGYVTVTTPGGTATGTVTFYPTAPTYSSLILAESSLVSYLRLQETTGTTSVDSKASYNGAYNGSYALGQSPIVYGETYSAKGNGSDTYIYWPVAVPSSAFSMELWLNPVGSNYYRIFSNARVDGNSSGGGIEVLLASALGNPITAWMQNTANADFYFVGTTNINDGTTYHLVVTFDGSTMKMYVNANLEGSVSFTGTFPSISSTLIGYVASAGGGAYFGGYMSDVALYSSALSSGDVAAHYAAGT